jgi:hypothetical protein
MLRFEAKHEEALDGQLFYMYKGDLQRVVLNAN